ncbi:MAG: hypothetical protein HY506_01560 [Candidatus Yanofskybacteria bacterium]|nr:hypothetical protein [Candidatus Yanofskybacteria bacterium]
MNRRNTTHLLSLIFLLLSASGTARCGELDAITNDKLPIEIKSGYAELAQLPLKHSPKTITYVEEIKRSDGAVIKKKRKDFAWKEIGLKLFNLDTGSTRIIKVRKEGLRLKYAYLDFVVTIEKRPSGLRWNDWNTAYRIESNDYGRWAVILNRWPRRLKNGRKEDAYYVPHSTALHLQRVSLAGYQYLEKSAKAAGVELSDLRPGIDSWPDFSSGEFGGMMVRLALIEHAEYFELEEFVENRWPYSPFDRVATIVGLNGPSAYSLTISPAGASGIMQYTNRSRHRRLGTWDFVRTNFPWARLPRFEVGAIDHRESMKAAMLLHSYNFKELAREFDKSLALSPDLEYYLAAAYNGGVGAVIKSIRQAQKRRTHWRKELRKFKKTNESIEYLEKLDYLLANFKSGQKDP